MKPADNSVSVIIVSRNTRELTLACVQSVYDAPPRKLSEVIIVDNDSSDGTPEAIHQCFPQAKLISSLRNIGFGAAMNLGARTATGSFLLLLNSDTQVTPDSIDALASVIERNDKTGIVAPTLVSLKGHEQSPLRSPVTLWTTLSNFARHRWQKRVDNACRHGSPPTGCAYLSGAAVMVSRKAFEEIQGFDESLFLYYEDPDLCKRLADQGWDMWFVSEARVIHAHGASTRSVSTGAAIENNRSLYLYMRKHYGYMSAVVVCLSCLIGAIYRVVSSVAMCVITIGMNQQYRKRLVNALGITTWFMLGMPARESKIYRALWCDWQASARK